MAVQARVTRFATGNFGDCKPLGEGVAESRIDLGPGYRVYFGVEGETVILLQGGDKSTQDADIQKAKQNWKDYKARRENEKRRGKLQKRTSSRSS
jgi:putative addiction module killer protein